MSELPPILNPEPEYLEVPVTYQFDERQVIGSLRIDATKLPKTPTYLFAIGGTVKRADMEWSETLGRQVYTIKDFELTHVALIPEDEYDWHKQDDVWQLERRPEAKSQPKPAVPLAETPRRKKRINTKPNVGG